MSRFKLTFFCLFFLILVSTTEDAVSQHEKKETACGTKEGAAFTLSLSSPCWSVFSPEGGAAIISDESGAIRFYGSGERRGSQAYFGRELDLTRAELYLKWKAHGPSGSYAAWGVGAGIIEEGIIKGVATAGWTSNRKGNGFTTNNIFKGSEVIDDDQWYYTRIKIDPQKQVTASTSSGNYDDMGGTPFYRHSYILDDEEFEKLSACSVYASFNDNYAGKETWMEIGEARVVKSCTDLCIYAKTDGRAVSLTWNTVPGADAYTLFYAFPDDLMQIDPATIGMIDMGSRTSVSFELSGGTGIYTAVMARGTGFEIFSNIEYFMTFTGRITLPESGAILAQISDEDHIGNFTISGTEVEGAPGLPLIKIEHQSESGSFLYVFDRAEAQQLDTSEKTGIYFDLTETGQIKFYFSVNGEVKYSGSMPGNRSEVLHSRSSIENELHWFGLYWPTPPEYVPPAVDEHLICISSRKEYEAWLNREDPEILSLKKGFGIIMRVLYMPALSRKIAGAGSDAVNFFIWLLEDMLLETARSIVALHDKKLADYDRICEGYVKPAEPECILQDSRYLFEASWVNDSSGKEYETSFTCELKPEGSASCGGYGCTWDQTGINFNLTCKSSTFSYHVIYSGQQIFQNRCSISGTIKRIDHPENHGTFIASEVK